MEKTYTIRQTSRILGMSVRTVREWIWTGRLKASKYPGSNMWRISETEITRITGMETKDADKY